MSAVLPQLHLYHHTLQPPSHIHQSIYGSFTAPKQHELCCVTGTGSNLVLYSVNSDTGTLVERYSTQVFGIIRHIQLFRLLGQSIDYIILGSDSGRITIVQYSPTKQCLVKLHDEPYGRSGCRRGVAGQYLACDPHGRAVLVSAIERHKLVYVLNRDINNNITISSPLEANKSNIIVLYTIGVDVGYDSPLFACIEYSYSNCNTESIQLQLVYYELDLGVNNVTRKLAQHISNTANMLIAVPGGSNGPGGLLLCSADTITYKRMDHTDIQCNIPRRYSLDIVDDKKGVMIISSATHVQKNLFFILIQNEFGDLFKITVQYNDTAVNDIMCQYFDTIPLCVSLNILKTGFLFTATETSNSALYQFISIGDNDNTPYTTSTQTNLVQYNVRKLTNLMLVDELSSISPLLQCKLLQPHSSTGNTTHLYSAVGTADRSTLRDLQYGLLMNELAVSELPGVPTNVFTIKNNYSDDYIQYIIVSFINATIVLSVSDSVEEITTSGIANDINTLHIYTLVNNTMVQIHSSGLYIISNGTRTSEWQSPNKKNIVCCTANGRQVAVGLTGGELIYFELDLRSNQLVDVSRIDLGNDISCITLNQTLLPDQLRTSYIAVSLFDNTVRLLSCQPDNVLQQIAMQATGELPVSLALCTQPHNIATHLTNCIYLYVGLKNGLYLCSRIDSDTGNIIETRKKLLGQKPVKLYTVQINNTSACIALSDTNYITYVHNNKLIQSQLTYGTMDCVASFQSVQCSNGLIGCIDNTLHIITYNKLNTVFNERHCQLRYTPRKLVIHSNNSVLVTVESDQNTYSETIKQSLQSELNGDIDTDLVGNPKAGFGRWGSCIRLIDRTTLNTLQCIQFNENHAGFSLCNVQFNNSDDVYLAVGTVQSLQFTPQQKKQSCAIHLYRYIQNDTNTQLQFVHSTSIDDIPFTMTQYNKKLLCGIGSTLRLYDLGQKKLLRQIELKLNKSSIVDLHTMNERIFISTQSDSVQFVQYNIQYNTFSLLASSILPRYITCSAVLDYNTIACGDKFGNIFIIRSSNTELQSYIEPEQNNTSNPPQIQRLTEIVSYHIGDCITSIQKCTWQSNGTEWLLYTTLHGTIGSLLPLSNKDEVEQLMTLEMHLRTELSNLVGRDHMSYRSYYTPVQSVSDGDLLQLYIDLPYDRQVFIAEQLTSTPATLVKHLDDLKSLII